MFWWNSRSSVFSSCDWHFNYRATSVLFLRQMTGGIIKAKQPNICFDRKISLIGKQKLWHFLWFNILASESIILCGVISKSPIWKNMTITDDFRDIDSISLRNIVTQQCLSQPDQVNCNVIEIIKCFIFYPLPAWAKLEWLQFEKIRNFYRNAIICCQSLI